MVGPEPLQRFVDRVENVGAHQLRRPAAAKPRARRAAHNFGGNDHLVAVLARLHPVADVGLGPALRLRLGRDRVELGRIHEVDAALESEVHLGVPVGLAVLLAPRHGAKADRGNMEIGAAETALLHGALRKGVAMGAGGTPGGKHQDRLSIVLRKAHGSRWNLGRRRPLSVWRVAAQDQRIASRTQGQFRRAWQAGSGGLCEGGKAQLCQRFRAGHPPHQGRSRVRLSRRRWWARGRSQDAGEDQGAGHTAGLDRRMDIACRQRPHPGDGPRCPRP